MATVHPAHGGRWSRKGLAGGWISTAGDDVVAVLEVRGEHAMVSGEMGARSWHEGSRGGPALVASAERRLHLAVAHSHLLRPDEDVRPRPFRERQAALDAFGHGHPLLLAGHQHFAAGA